MEAHEGRSLPNPAVAGALNRLVKTGLIIKKDRKYHITDPLLALGILQDPFLAE